MTAAASRVSTSPSLACEREPNACAYKVTPHHNDAHHNDAPQSRATRSALLQLDRTEPLRGHVYIDQDDIDEIEAAITTSQRTTRARTVLRLPDARCSPPDACKAELSLSSAARSTLRLDVQLLRARGDNEDAPAMWRLQQEGGPKRAEARRIAEAIQSARFAVSFRDGGFAATRKEIRASGGASGGGDRVAWGFHGDSMGIPWYP